MISFGYLLQVVAATGNVWMMSWLMAGCSSSILAQEQVVLKHLDLYLDSVLAFSLAASFYDSCPKPTLTKDPMPERLWKDAVICLSTPGPNFALRPFHLVSDSMLPFDLGKLWCPCVCLHEPCNFYSLSALKSFQRHWNQVKSILLHLLMLLVFSHYLLLLSGNVRLHLPVCTWIWLLFCMEELCCDLFLLLIVSSVSDICKAPTPAFLHLMGFFPEMQETAVEGLALRFLWKWFDSPVSAGRMTFSPRSTSRQHLQQGC